MCSPLCIRWPVLFVIYRPLLVCECRVVSRVVPSHVCLYRLPVSPIILPATETRNCRNPPPPPPPPPPPSSTTPPIPATTRELPPPHLRQIRLPYALAPSVGIRYDGLYQDTSPADISSSTWDMDSTKRKAPLDLEELIRKKREADLRHKGSYHAYFRHRPSDTLAV